MLETLLVINKDKNIRNPEKKIRNPEINPDFRVWTLHFKNQPREGALYLNFYFSSSSALLLIKGEVKRHTSSSMSSRD